jgi:hypothetical protein
MNYLKIIISSTLLLIIFSCKDDSPIEPDDSRPGDGDGQLITSKTIGPSGGEIGNNSFVFSVPSGAFSENTYLEVSEIDNTSGFESVSKVYKVEGILTGFNNAIKIKIKPISTNNQDVKILFMYDNLIRSTWQKGDGFMFLDAQLVNGFYETELNVGNSHTRPKLLKTFDDPEIGDFVQICGKFVAVVSQKTYNSSSGHFRIYYPSTVSSSSIVSMNGYLEDAYDKITNTGFGWAKRSKWPLEVTVTSLGSEVYGQASFSYLWGINYSTIKVNLSHVNEVDELRTSLSHELLHIAQDFYDPFSWEHLWLDEATAVWFEELNSTQSQYVSSAMDGYYTASLLGIANISQKSTGDQGGYGYGLAPMIKYVVQKEGESAVSLMYKLIESGAKPCNVIDDVTTESVSDWFEPFLSDYILGKIYPGVSASYFISDARTEKYDVTHVYVQDRLTENYDDLSGRLYNFTFKYSVNEEKNYKMSFEPQWANITLFKYRGSSTIEKLGDWPGLVNVQDLNAYVSGNYGILALVTNGIHNSSYTGNKSISLAIETKEMQNQIDFTKFKILHIGLETQHGADRCAVVVWDAEIQSYSEGHFTASYYENSYEGNVIITKEVEIFINTDIPMITSCTVNSSHTSYGVHTEQRFTCENIPFWYYDALHDKDLAFDVYGEEACSKLTDFYYYSIDQAGNVEEWGLDAIYCNEYSDIEIRFWEEK